MCMLLADGEPGGPLSTAGFGGGASCTLSATERRNTRERLANFLYQHNRKLLV